MDKQAKQNQDRQVAEQEQNKQILYEEKNDQAKSGGLDRFEINNKNNNDDDEKEGVGGSEINTHINDKEVDSAEKKSKDDEASPVLKIVKFVVDLKETVKIDKLLSNSNFDLNKKEDDNKNEAGTGTGATVIIPEYKDPSDLNSLSAEKKSGKIL